MKFLITRTSNWNGMDDLKLSKRWNITREKFDRVERFTLKSFEEFDKKFENFEGPFLSKGTNHRKVNGCIERTLKNNNEGQFIEINTLEDLVDLQNECGDIIMTLSMWNPNVNEIEIYDDYRE